MLGGHVIVEIDRCDRTLGDARTAIDALIGVDEHLDPGEAGATFGSGNLSEFIERDGTNDAVTRAHVDACAVTCSDALLGNDIGHVPVLSTGRSTS